MNSLVSWGRRASCTPYTKIIGFEAFNGSDITSVTFNSSLQKINGFAFNRNTKLTEVKGNLTGLQYINYNDGSVPTVNGFGQSPFNGKDNFSFGICFPLFVIFTVA